MNNRKCCRGDAIYSLLSGLGGVVVGAVLVFIVMYSQMSRMAASDGQATPSPAAPVAESTTAPQPNEPNSDGGPAPVAGIPGGTPSQVADAVAKVQSAVVNIDTTALRRVVQQGPFGYSFGSGVKELPQGMGTGVLVSSDGIVLTNNHVISKAETINVTLGDRRQFVAKVLGADPITDLAILKIEGRDFPKAQLASSASMRTGDWVVALGNPLGVGQTATVGVLSARGRHISDSSVELRDLLQTDAAINPGNSGGPLVNMSGQVIGINTAIIPYAQGIGFAIPAETAITIVSDLQRFGKVVRPYLGIQMGELTPAVRRYLELPDSTEGVVIGGVLPDGPADQAGLKGGDVICKIAGHAVSNSSDLQGYIRSQKVDSKIKLTIIRERKTLDITVTLREMPTRLLPAR